MSGSGFRVALVNNYPGPTMGGGEVQLLHLVRGLVARGIAVTVACEAGSAFEEGLRGIPTVTAVPCRFGAGSLVRLPGQLAQAFADADLVQGTGFLTNVVARRVGALTGLPVVNAVQVVPGAARLDGERWPVAVVRALLDRIGRTHVRCFVVPSGAVRDGLLRTGVDGSSVRVVPNGIDVQALAGISRSRRAGVEDGSGGPRIGYAGRLVRVKGCEWLIRAFPLILGRHPDARLLIAGAGPEEPRLRDLANRLRVADRTDFLGYLADPIGFLVSLDVVVVPSLSEAFGLTAVEALALGRPVVATRTGGLAEIIDEGRTGLLVPTQEPDALALAVVRLLDDPRLAERLGREGQADVAVRFGLDAMVDGYIDVYQDLTRTRD